ncbi:MAG: cell filamentation protein Fic [Bacteroidetes bacterium HGW-Bacteroidetes-12]|nr:MAG: cell filamentation protein Fic [Bacteroidetes bacterium HGW-Bacteroidetes-12]
MDLSKYQPNSQFLLYKTDKGDIKVDVMLQNETIWLPQIKIAELFEVKIPAISKHLKNIFESGELNEKVVVSILEITTQHGAIADKTQTKSIKFYNLDAIIAVGYRVNSNRATQFRIWATAVLKEFIIKGYTMDVERLKNPQPIFGQDYFKEQLEKIRDIRSSERRFYQQITDIYAECSIDYDYDSEITKEFFATVQNKLHWAITKQTAAANHEKEKMGLTNWKNSPGGKIRKSDVSIAKNYLTADELKPLNRIVSMYLDYAEDQAEQGIAMTMKDWAEKLNAFLQFNQKDILQNAGKVTAAIAKEFAENEYEKYKPIQDKLFESDFDKEIKKLLKGK